MGIASAVVLLGLVVLLFNRGCCDHDIRVESLIPSPNADLQAFVYLDIGGGALGWCDRGVALRAASDSGLDLKKLERSRGLVFEANCGSNVRVAWPSATELHIGYTVDARHILPRRTNPAAADGRIRVTYEVLSNIHDIHVESLILSPNADLQAIVYRDMGNAVGWCDRGVALHVATGAGANLKKLEDGRGLVFEANCGSDVRVTWPSATELHIGYTIDPRHLPVHRRNATAADGRIRVTYEVLNN